MQLTALRPRERDALIQSLRAGGTSLLGARHIQVWRDAELAALEKRLDHMAEGGPAFKLVVGEYGSGKTFFLNLVTDTEIGASGARGAWAASRCHQLRLSTLAVTPSPQANPKAIRGPDPERANMANTPHDATRPTRLAAARAIVFGSCT